MVKTYRTLFFDADDTLLDFGAAEKDALRMLFAEQEIPLTSDVETLYKKINRNLWESFEEGRISRDHVVNSRFALLFRELGHLADGAALEKSYRSYLEKGHQLVQGAFDLVASLSKHFNLYIVTNGVSETQDKRLRESGLYPFFDGIFVSEDTGFQKPMKSFFDYVFERIPNFSVEQSLIIGDSLSSDILGGHTAGIDTCWYNPSGKVNHTNAIPTYEIRSLQEIQHLLNIESGCSRKPELEFNQQ